MTDEKRQEMAKFKEKAMAYEYKLKGKRVSLDSGVMIASTEIQKLENYELPSNVSKDLDYEKVNNINKVKTEEILKANSSISPETPTLVSEEDKEFNLTNSFSGKESISINTENVTIIEKSCDTLIPKQESNVCLHLINHDKNNLNNRIFENESISTKSEHVSLIENSCNSLISNQEPTNLPTIRKSSVCDNTTLLNEIELMPRLRSNSYTLSSPSPVMVAFLNSQVQNQLIEPKSVENINNINKESKSEPSIIFVADAREDKILKSKSISHNSVPESLHNQKHNASLVEYRNSSIVSTQTINNTIPTEKQDERGSVTTIGTNFSFDETVVGSVMNGNSFVNSDDINSNPSSITFKSVKHCICRHSDEEYTFSSNNMHYKTSEELHLEAERLRVAKLDIERRHQEELSNLLKKQREEQEQIAVRYYLVSQSSSGMSFDDSEYSESLSKQLKTNSLSIQSELAVTNDKSLLSDTSSIISNCSMNKNLACSSPRQKTPSHSPHLHQNIKFYHKMRGLTSKWTKAPTEVENSAATIINAGVRGYLTRRLLRTEKAQLLKKTILDSLKTALIMHMELKKQEPTESDLELHQRIINQVPTYKHVYY